MRIFLRVHNVLPFRSNGILTTGYAEVRMRVKFFQTFRGINMDISRSSSTRKTPCSSHKTAGGFFWWRLFVKNADTLAHC